MTRESPPPLWPTALVRPEPKVNLNPVTFADLNQGAFKIPGLCGGAFSQDSKWLAGMRYDDAGVATIALYECGTWKLVSETPYGTRPATIRQMAFAGKWLLLVRSDEDPFPDEAKEKENDEGKLALDIFDFGPVVAQSPPSGPAKRTIKRTLQSAEGRISVAPHGESFFYLHRRLLQAREVDLRSFTILKTIPDLPPETAAIALAPSGKTLFVVTTKQLLRRYDIETREGRTVDSPGNVGPSMPFIVPVDEEDAFVANDKGFRYPGPMRRNGMPPFRQMPGLTGLAYFSDLGITVARRPGIADWMGLTGRDGETAAAQVQMDSPNSHPHAKELIEQTIIRSPDGKWVFLGAGVGYRLPVPAK